MCSTNIIEPNKKKVKCDFYARSQNCEKRLLASSYLSIRPFVRMEQLCSHWKDFREI